MKRPNITPGKWDACTYPAAPDVHPVCNHTGKMEICECRWPAGIEESEVAANQRAIAALPDLLEALECLIDTTCGDIARKALTRAGYTF